MNLNKFITLFLFIVCTTIYCQNNNKLDSMNIKITDVESTSKYYIYRYVEFERCMVDTLIVLEKKPLIQQNNSLEIDEYYHIRYKSESIMAKPSQNENFIQDNIRLSGNFGIIMIMDVQKIDSLNINKLSLSYDCLSYSNFEDFELFLQKFINDENFRNSRINFNDKIKPKKKQIKKWEKAENFLLNYKINKFKRDKVYYNNYRYMYFRIYKGYYFDTLMAYISYIFRLDDNNQWYLSSYKDVNDFFNKQN